MGNRRRTWSPGRRESSAGLGAALATTLLVVAWPGEAAARQQKPDVETEECVNDACHAVIAKGPVVHRPVAQGECEGCHELASPQEHRFVLVAPPDELCWECHDVEFDEVVHAPVEDGQCMGCHDPHRSSSPLLLIQDIAQGLCLTCHEDYDQKKYVHGPVAAQACAVCHHSHTSAQPSLLLSGPDELCHGCHTEATPTGPAARSQHDPVYQGCRGCHDPHASDIRYQLLEAPPQLCFSCHEDVRQTIDESPVVHRLPAETGCMSCHQPHFSAEPALLAGPQADVCLGCHDRPVSTPQGQTLEDLAAKLQDHPRPHGPVRNGDCTACHQPHAGEHFRLLVEAYPPGFYATFDPDRFKLCFLCHLEDLALEESGTGLTGFRDGDRNLHWLHVNRKKGRTCSVCHEVHASRQPFHLRESVPFGTAGWTIRLGYQPLETGGTCAPDCHAPASYRRRAGPGSSRTTSRSSAVAAAPPVIGAAPDPGLPPPR